MEKLKMVSFFERKERASTVDGGEFFWTLRKDDCDGVWEKLRSTIYECHGDMMPNDWIFSLCHAIACAYDNGEISIEDGQADEDSVHEFADGYVDVYTRARFEWAAEFCLSSLYSDAESEAEGMGEAVSVADRIGHIQYCAVGHIVRKMVEVFEQIASDAEESASVESEF